MSYYAEQSPQNPNAFNLGNIYPNAFFDYLSRLMPRRLKTLFTWLEYLYVNCGQVFSVIKKFSEYPITSLTYESEDKESDKRLEVIMDQHIKIKAVLIQEGIDYFVYGNSFTSLYRPFTRYLVCPDCGQKHNATQWPYEWMPQKFEFRITCSNKRCGKKVIAKVEMEKLNDPSKLRVIRWDPKYIDINYNPMTGDCEYYYDIPETVRKRIKTKEVDKFLLNTLPWEFVEAIRDKKVFKFRDDEIFHMKNPAPAGINQEWGYPGLLGCLKPFFYTAILRKGNEAIALERLVPWRVLYPQPTTSSNDPGMYVALSRWKVELQDAVKKWRRDPNMIKLSPIPVGMQQIGGDARPMLTHQEIALTEELIITSMGVPKEFIYGGLTHAGGSVTLRMLENLLFTYTGQLIEQAQWLTDKVCKFTGLKPAKVDMTDFKLVDDIQQKTLVGRLFEARKVSGATFLKALDIDPDIERKNILEDSIEDAKLESEINKSLRKLQDTMASKVDASLEGNPLSYDPNAVMSIAYQEAQTMASMSSDDRRERLKMLQAQDPVMYAVVNQALSEIFRKQRQQGAVLAQQGGMAMPQEYAGGSSPSTPRAGN